MMLVVFSNHAWEHPGRRELLLALERRAARCVTLRAVPDRRVLATLTGACGLVVDGRARLELVLLGLARALAVATFAFEPPSLPAWLSPATEAERWARSLSPRDGVVERVVSTLRARSARGLQKYGVSLERQDLKLDDWLKLAQEELLDGANYLQRARERLTEPG